NENGGYVSVGLDNTKLEVSRHLLDLVEDACLGLCFEVHRADQSAFSWVCVQSVENKECVCPNCNRSIAASPLCPSSGEMLGHGAQQQIASSNNMNNKSESDQEDNDDVNDNDWSYGSEKKGENKTSVNPYHMLFSFSGELSNSVNADPYKYNYNTGINYETLGPDELRSLLTTQCGVISEHTKKMCTRSQRCPQHTDEQRRAVRVFLLGPSASSLPDADTMVESDCYDASDGQVLMSRLQWDGSSDISPSDSASSKASTNNSDSKKPKKKKTTSLGLNSTGGGGGGSGSGGGSSSQSSLVGQSNRKKKPKLPVPSAPSIYDNLN
uniref:SCA7 domain-containing protein n=1 Tax=Oncorhynchus tshawytscha TaxID=74940 RepID=A0AAZ3RJI8_ONCTS